MIASTSLNISASNAPAVPAAEDDGRYPQALPAAGGAGTGLQERAVHPDLLQLPPSGAPESD